MGEAKRKARLFERRGNLTILDRRGAHDFDGKCEFCGTTDELRPYGPNNENICYDCAMKDEATTRRKFREMLDNQNG